MIYRLIVLCLLCLTACGGESAPPTLTPTLVPSLTPTEAVTATPQPTPTATEETTQVEIQLEPQAGVTPPYEITLPDGWQAQYFAIPIQDIDGDISVIQTATYAGPVTGGVGIITTIWGYSSITTVNPITGAGGDTSLYLDGLRFWRLLVVEQDCTVGTDLQRNFTVGTQDAIGTFVSAVECGELGDTAGWFAGVEVDELNFLFYAYVDPREIIETGADTELQAILDTVRFDVIGWLTETPDLTPAP